MSNNELYKAALEAVQNLFGDKSVSQSEAKRNLQALVDEIMILLDSLSDDDE